MQMPGRKYQEANYRFGFNGQENDNELKGNGNSLNFGGRSIYDSRLGRFTSIDPRWRSYPYWSPYHYAANNPIFLIDENGEGPVTVTWQYYDANCELAMTNSVVVWEDNGTDQMQYVMHRTQVLASGEEVDLPNDPASYSWGSSGTGPEHGSPPSYGGDHLGAIGDGLIDLGESVVNAPTSVVTGVGSAIHNGIAYAVYGPEEYYGNDRRWGALSFDANGNDGDGSVINSDKEITGMSPSTSSGQKMLENTAGTLLMLAPGGNSTKLLPAAKPVNLLPASTTGSALARFSGMLRDAAKFKGNFNIGEGSAKEAMELGKAWVGNGYTVASDGKTLISSSGLRQFRPPSFKPRLNKQQANFEWRNETKGAWQGNGHLDIIE